MSTEKNCLAWVVVTFILVFVTLASILKAQTRPSEDASQAFLEAMNSSKARARAERLWREEGVEGFHAAVALGMTDAVKERLKKHRDLINELQDSTSPLAVAIANDQRQIVAILLDAGAKLDAGYVTRTPLFIASQFGRVWAVQALLTKGVIIPDDPKYVGRLLDATVSGWDAARDNERTLELLIAAGVLDKVGDRLQSVLLNAAGDPAILRQLVRHVRDKQALSYALSGIAYSRSADAAEILIDAGADVNMPSDRRQERYTPLHVAASAGRNEMVSYLLSRGADPHAKDANGKSPAEIAEAYGHESTADMIRANKQETSPLSKP